MNERFEKKVLMKRIEAKEKVDKILLKELDSLGHTIWSKKPKRNDYTTALLLVLFIIGLITAILLTIELTEKPEKIRFNIIENKQIIKETLIENNPKYVIDRKSLNISSTELCLGNETVRTCYKNG